MKIYTSIPASLPTTALTIGFFDGVHRGHRDLLRALKETGEHTTVLTFLNHPLKTLKPSLCPPSLTPWPLKLALLEQADIDAAILLPFTPAFAATAYDQLLSQFSLSHLILGKGSAFGKHREGNEANLKGLAESQKFSLYFLPKSVFEGQPISSSAIRQAIASNNLSLAASLLGRPHALYFPAGETEIFAKDLCLPPDGSYFVSDSDGQMELSIKTTETRERCLKLSRPLAAQTLLSFDSEIPHHV